MNLKLRRIVIGAIMVEVLAVLALVLIVVMFGPSDRAAAQAYAERIGYWVGPIAGFAFSVLGGFWVARGLSTGYIRNGLVLGLLAAAIDIGILVAGGAAFQPMFALSNAGRIVAGSIGGSLAMTTATIRTDLR